MPFPIQEAFPIFILISRRIKILACELAFKLRIRERKSRKKESRREWMRRERRGEGGGEREREEEGRRERRVWADPGDIEVYIHVAVVFNDL